MELSTERREEQVRAGARQLRRKLPVFKNTESKPLEDIARCVIEASEIVRNPELEFISDCMRALDDYLVEYGRNPASSQTTIAHRNLQEIFYGKSAVDRSGTWDLTNEKGEVVGSFTGSESAFHRLQESIL